MAGVERELVHGLFTPVAEQIARVREWNRKLGWNFSDEAFAEVEKSIPEWPEERLVVVVLVPYLAEKVGVDKIIMTGLERTFHELWERAKAEQDKSWRWIGYNKAGSDRLRLLSGIEHKVGLRWEVIDLGSNRKKMPMYVRSSEFSPSAGILAAAALHPDWVKSMDGNKVPYVWVPGYEMQFPGEEPWTYVPNLRFGRGSREIRLYCYGCGDGYSAWAVPSFFRE